MKSIANSKKLFFIFLVFCTEYLSANPIPSGSALTIVAPTTITLPGSYRLGNDIQGTVTIDASNVELNLDNRKITTQAVGIEINPNNTDIVIKNGIIEGDTLAPGVMTMSFTTTAIFNIQFPNAIGDGILIDTCTNVTISDVDFIENDYAVHVLSSTCITVENCSIRSFGVTGINFEDTDNTLIENCKFLNDNGVSTIGVFAQFGENHIIRGNSINSTNGIGIDVCNTNNCLIENNSLNENQVGIGIVATDSSIIIGNTGVQNLAGIFSLGTESLYKNNSMNNSGFGILTLVSFFNCFVENITNQNTTSGVNAISSDDTYFLNKSQLNGASGTANFLGVSPNIIITYSLGLGDFTVTNTRPFLNLAVIP